MSRIPAIFIQIVDTTGEPVPSGRLYTHDAGSGGGPGTYKTTWSNPEKTIPHANPIVANAAGIIGPVYLSDNEGYLFIESDASASQLRSEDNVFSALLSDTELSTRIKQIASNPLDYGAIGDGVSDDTAAVQQAIDNVSGRGCVDLLGLTYKCDTQLTINDSLKFVNGVLDFTDCTDDEFIVIHGNISVASTLTADIDNYNNSINVDTSSGLAQGDLCVVRDTQLFRTNGVPRGEMFTIGDLNPTTVAADRTLDDNYQLVSSAQIHKVDAIENILFQDVKILGTRFVVGNKVCISCVGTKDAVFSRVAFDGVDHAAIRLSTCYNTTIKDCVFEYGVAGVELGFITTNTKIYDCSFLNTTSGVQAKSYTAPGDALLGPVRHLTIERCEFVATASTTPDDFISIFEDAAHVHIYKNRFVRGDSSSPDYAIHTECTNVFIKDNEIYGQNSAFAYDAIFCEITTLVRTTPSEQKLEIVGNRIRSDDGKFIVVSLSGTATLDRLLLQDNSQKDGSGNVEVTIGCPVDKIEAIANKLTGDLQIGKNGTATVENIHLLRNQVVDIDININGTVRYITSYVNALSGTYDISTSPLVESVLRMANDVIDAFAQINCLDNTYLTDMTCLGAALVTTAGHIEVIGGYYVGINATGLYIIGSAGSSVKLEGVKGHSTNANGIRISGYFDYGQVGGCFCSSDTGAALYLSGSIASAISNVIIGECTLRNAPIGISASNTVNVSLTGNQFINCTVDVSGITISDEVSLGQIKLKSVSVTVPWLQTTQLRASPFTLIPAKAGVVFCPVKGFIQLNSAGVAFTAGAGDDLAVRYKDGTGPICANIETTGFLDQTSDRFTLFDGASSGAPIAMLSSDCVNQPVVLHNIGLAEFGGGSAGVTLEVTLFYFEVTTT